MKFRSRFAPVIDNEEYRAEVFAVIGEILAGKINRATARWRLMVKLKNLGYQPRKGFPSAFEVGWREKLDARPDVSEDLACGESIDLILSTEVSLIRGERQWQEGNQELARYAYPAWELIQIGRRELPTDCADTRPGEWERRWEAAGQHVGWKNALRARMVALKESPIWQALGNGVGSFKDALGFPYPPFALNSARGWQAVKRSECEALRFTLKPSSKTAIRTPRELDEAFEKLGPDFRKRLLDELSE